MRSMIMQYGMSDVLGPIAYGEGSEHQIFLGRDFSSQRNYSEEVAGEIDKEVHRYMEEAYTECKKILIENRDALERIAQALMDKETLTAAELKAIVFGAEQPQAVIQPPPPPPPPAPALKLAKPTFETLFEPEPPTPSSNPSPV